MIATASPCENDTFNVTFSDCTWFFFFRILFRVYLEVARNVPDKVVDNAVAAFIWSPGQQDELGSQQRDEDERGSHCLHVGVGFSTVGLFQLGDEDPHDVEEKEEVHL